VTNLVGQQRAGNRVGNRRPKHVARDLDRRASGYHDQSAGRAPQDDGKPDERLDRRKQVERERKRGGGEQIEVDSDTLIGIVSKAVALDPVEGTAVKPFLQVARGQPLAPSESKHLPQIAVVDRDHTERECKRGER